MHMVCIHVHVHMYQLMYMCRCVCVLCVCMLHMCTSEKVGVGRESKCGKGGVGRERYLSFVISLLSRKATMDVYKTLTGNTEVGEAMGGALVN